MTDDEGAAHAKLLAEYRALEEEYEGQDEFPEEIDARLGELEVAMEKLEARSLIFDAEEIARAGAFVTLDRYGELSAGSHVAGFGHGTVITSAGQALGANVPDDEDDGALKPLPERLIMELTAHRTLALREAVGRSPDVALTLLLLKLVGDTFGTSNSAGSCLEVSVRHVHMAAQASDLKDSLVAKLVDDRQAEWEADLPLGDDAAPWDYLTSLDQGSRLSLLAHCLSFGINALHEKVNPYGAGISAGGLTKRMTQSDLVAQAIELDMVEAGWEPSVDTYLNRVPKARILEAVREAKREGTAQLLEHLKKGEMATEAERLLKGSGWLPEVLRRHDPAALDGAEEPEGSEPISDTDQTEDVDLPAFLTADLPGDDASAPTPRLAALWSFRSVPRAAWHWP